MKWSFFDLIIFLAVVFFINLVLLPMVALFTTPSFAELISQFQSPMILSAVLISLETSMTVVILACFIGIPVAYLLAMKAFKGKIILDTLVDLPISIPPLVAGLALLILIGNNGLLGGMLSRYGIELIFSKKGIITAQLFVSMPFLIKSTREAFESIDKNVINAALMLNASSFSIFWKILLPMAKNGIYAGMVMTWARAMGEFGATSMVAGCIPFKTETMTIAIYQNVMSGELNASIAVSMLLTLFSFTLLILFKLKAKRQVLH